MMEDTDIEAIASDIVDCAIKIYKALGPGLLESAYQHCLAYELKKRGWDTETEVKLPTRPHLRPLSRWERGENPDDFVVFGQKIRFIYPFPSPFGRGLG